MMCEGEVRDVFMLSTISEEDTAVDSEIQHLLDKVPLEGSGLISEFTDIFSEPKQLPPYRSSDHRIFLQPNTQPVNVRPYRYLYFQMDIIERLVREMED